MAGINPKAFAFGCLVVALLATQQGKCAKDADGWELDDDNDEFWKDKEPKDSKVKYAQDGSRLIPMTIRFLTLRLKPDPTRMMEDVIMIQRNLQELLNDAGMGLDKVQVQDKDTLSMQTREELEDLQEVLFEEPSVYELATHDRILRRPGDVIPYAELRMSVYGPEATSQGGLLPEPPEERKPRKGKKKKKSKRAKSEL